MHHAVLLLMHAHLKGATLHGQETVPQPLGLLCPHVSPPTTKECTMYIIYIYIYICQARNVTLCRLSDKS